MDISFSDDDADGKSGGSAKIQKAKDRRPAATKRAEYLARFGHASNPSELWGRRADNGTKSFSRGGRKGADHTTATKLRAPVVMSHKSTKTSENWDQKLEWEGL